MARAPRAAKKSAAQVAAGKAFAAGGRRAQAKARAKGKAPTKAQHQAALRWAAAGRASQAAKRAHKKPAPKKTAALPMTHLPWADPLLWLPGCNTELPTCVSVAVANHLLAQTGIIASDTDILELHDHAGGNDGACLGSVLDAASYHGLAGVKLAKFWQCDENQIVPGLVYGVKMRRGRHVVLAHPYGMVSWGMVLSWAGQPDEAWALEWELNR